MINKLRKINKNLLFNAKTKEEKKKQELIMRILKDDFCFNKMSIEDAYNILRDLKVKEEELKSIYTSLIGNNIKKILEK